MNSAIFLKEIKIQIQFRVKNFSSFSEKIKIQATEYLNNFIK